MRGFVRLDKLKESGMLIVYSTIRKINPEMSQRGGIRAQLAMEIIHDAIGRDDIDVELITGEDWVARSESADCISSQKLIMLIC
jgi:hypothetical protein